MKRASGTRDTKRIHSPRAQSEDMPNVSSRTYRLSKRIAAAVNGRINKLNRMTPCAIA